MKILLWYIKKKKIITNEPLLSYNNIYPLPTCLLYNEKYFKVEKNIYSFTGPENMKVNLYGNRYLPIFGKDPIPFTLPIINRNSIKLVTINKLNKLLGTDNENFGFCSDGFFKDKSVNLKYSTISEPWSTGDIIGIGIIYYDYNKIKPFITYNKILIEIPLSYNYNSKLIPVITCNSSFSIKVNIFNKKLLFDIERYLHNNNVFSSVNQFINKNNFDLKKYDVEVDKTEKQEHKLSILLPNLQTEEMTNLSELFFSLILNEIWLRIIIKIYIMY